MEKSPRQFRTEKANMSFTRIDPLSHLTEQEKDEYYCSLVDNRPGAIKQKHREEHLASEEVREFRKLYPLWNPLEFLTDLEYGMPEIELIHETLSKDPSKINGILPNALDTLILTQIGYGHRTFTRRIYDGPFKRRGIFYTVQLKESRVKKENLLNLKLKIKPIRSMTNDTYEPDEQLIASVFLEKEKEFRSSFEPKIMTALRLASRLNYLDSKIAYISGLIEDMTILNVNVARESLKISTCFLF